jgi:hypothetical protein
MSEQPRDIAIRTDSRASLQAAMLTLLSQARHEVAWYTRDLDPLLSDQKAILEAFRLLSIRSRARIRILVQDLSRAIQEGHRLIEASRRLSSIYAIRQVHADDLAYNSSFFVTDAGGWLFRVFADRLEAEGQQYDPPRMRSYLRYFDEVWERASAPLELRSLGL